MRFFNLAYHTRDGVLAFVVLVGIGAHDNNLGVVFYGGQGEDLLGAAINDGVFGLLSEKDVRGLADTVGDEGTPPDLVGVTAADGVILALAGHAVSGAHWQAMQ